jgi:hypothetical protein
VTVLPATAVLGVAVNCTTGELSATVTVIDCVAGPLGPLQVSVNSVVLVSGPVGSEPLVGTVELQPLLLEAMHVSALGAFQLSVVCAPRAMVVAAAVSPTDVAGFWVKT